jgi:morphogenetic protein associated with SpoVID
MKIHVTRPGDTLWVLAQKYNVPAERLREANPDLGDSDELRPGLKVRVPTGKVPIAAPGKEEKQPKTEPEELSMFYPHVPAESTSAHDFSYEEAGLADEQEEWGSSALETDFEYPAPDPAISAPHFMPYGWPPPGYWPPYPAPLADPAAYPMMAGPECCGFVPYHPFASIHSVGWPAPWADAWHGGPGTRRADTWHGGPGTRRNMKESSSREG